MTRKTVRLADPACRIPLPEARGLIWTGDEVRTVNVEDGGLYQQLWREGSLVEIEDKPARPAAASPAAGK